MTVAGNRFGLHGEAAIHITLYNLSQLQWNNITQIVFLKINASALVKVLITILCLAPEKSDYPFFKTQRHDFNKSSKSTHFV